MGPDELVFTPGEDFDVVGIEGNCRLSDKYDDFRTRSRKAMPLVYIAGKYRDKRGMFGVDENVALAKRVSVAFWKAGFSVICPHANTYNMDDGTVTSDMFIAGDLEQIRRCDAVVLLPNWTDSEGAKKEKEWANKIGVRTFTLPQPELELNLAKFVSYVKNELESVP